MKMMHRSIFVYFVLLLLFLNFPLFAQGNISVRLDTYLPNGGIMYLSDLGLIDVEHAPLLFALTIENYFPAAKEIILKFGIRRGDEILIDGMTKPFMIEGNGGAPGRIYLTNQNIFADDLEYSLQNIDITDATEELKNTILSTGKLPSGAYTFYAEILDAQDQHVYAQDSRTLIFESPTLLDLVSPGAPASQGDLPEIYTRLPFFQWDSDASKFEITVCEKLPSNTDPLDVMHNEPRLQTIVENQKYFQYPPTAWELEEGKVYYWQIVALIPSASGETRLESAVWGFRLADMTEGSNSAEHQQLMMVLQSMFDSQNFAGLFGEGGPLDGFQFTGAAYFNGRAISIQEITNLLNQILQGKIEVSDFAVE